MQKWVEGHKQWVNALLSAMKPEHGHAAVAVRVSHGRDGKGSVYPAQIHLPPHLHLPELLARFESTGGARDLRDDDGSDAQWVTLHDELHGQHPLFVSGDRIVGGASGRLNGLRVSGLQDREAYHHLGQSRQSEEELTAQRGKKQARIQAEILAREAEAAGEQALTAPQVHIFPLASAQVRELARLFYAHAAAKQGDRSAIRLLSPDSFDDTEEGEQDMTAAELAHHADALRDERIEEILHGHDESAKLAFVKEFLQEHRDEPTVIVARNQVARHTLLRQLEASGIAAGHAEDSKHSFDALAGFAGLGGRVEHNALVVPDAKLLSGFPLSDHHLISLDEPAVEPSARYGEVHILQSDNPHEDRIAAARAAGRHGEKSEPRIRKEEKP